MTVKIYIISVLVLLFLAFTYVARKAIAAYAKRLYISRFFQYIKKEHFFDPSGETIIPYSQ